MSAGCKEHNPADENDGPFKDVERVAQEAAGLAVQALRDHAHEQLQGVKPQEEIIRPLNERAEFRRDARWHVKRHEHAVCEDHAHYQEVDRRRIEEPQARAPRLLIGPEPPGQLRARSHAALRARLSWFRLQ